MRGYHVRFRSQKPEARSEKPEARNHPEARSRKTEARSQKPGNNKINSVWLLDLPGFSLLASDLWLWLLKP
jgi:hypothetical protein